MPNRFSQIIQPYVVNPIDINMFTMAPLAKARAKAMGIRAAESYMFDYNIDKKDSEYINPLVKDVTQQKDDIVSRIQTEGVTNNLVNKLVQTKKNYNNVKADIKKAEINKDLIDKWNNKLLMLHKGSTYGEFVKNKEYERGWKGTFSPDGTTNTFDAAYGPQYFDMVGGYTKALSGIRMELDKETLGGGYITTIKDSTTGQTRSVFVNSQGTKIYSNQPKVMEQLKILKEKYNDPTTTEGAYAKYIGMTPDAINKMGDMIANRMIETETKRGNVSRRLLSIPTPPELEEEEEIPDRPPGNAFIVGTKTNIGHAEKVNDANTAKIIKNTVYHLADLPLVAWEEFGKFKERYEEAEKEGKWYDNRFTNFFTAHNKTWDVIRERKAETDKDMNKWNKKSTAQKEAYTKRFVEKFSSDYLIKEGINYKFQTNWTTANNYPIVKKDILEQEFDNTAGATIYDKGRDASGNEDFVEDIVDYYVKASDTQRAYTFNQLESSPLASIKGFKNNPKAYMEYYVTQAGLLDGNIAVKNLGTGKLLKPGEKLDQEELQTLQKTIRNYSGAAGADTDSKIYMDFQGIGTSEPGLYTVYDPSKKAYAYNEKLAYGAKVRIFTKDKNGDEIQLGSYLIGNTSSTRQDPVFKKLSTKMDKMGNLKKNEVLDITFAKRQGLDFNSKQNVKAEVHRNTFERQGLDSKGNLVIIPKDQLMYYIEGENLPRWYNAGDIGHITVDPNAVTKRFGSFGLKEIADNTVSAMSQETFNNVMSNTTNPRGNHGALY